MNIEKTDKKIVITDKEDNLHDVLGYCNEQDLNIAIIYHENGEVTVTAYKK